MWTLLDKALAGQFHYRFNFLAYLAIVASAQSITFFYLYTIYTYTDDINGWTFRESVFVFYLATIVVLTAECLTSSINHYYRTLAAGRLEPLLMLPVSRPALQLLRWSEPGFLLPVGVLLMLWPFFDPHPDRPWLDWLVGFVVLAHGVASIVLVFALVSLVTLVTQRLTPADFMVSELSNMIFLPIGVFPAGTVRVLVGVVFPMLLSLVFDSRK